VKATVRSLGVHLPRKTVILAACKPEALVKVDIPSPLERYLGRSADHSFDHAGTLTITRTIPWSRNQARINPRAIHVNVHISPIGAEK
jgi:hypothetical protein